jgi:hypothetical protein
VTLKQAPLFLFLLAAILGFSRGSYGQSTEQFVDGFLVGDSGSVLSQATVSLRNTNDSLITSSLSDDKGYFLIYHNLKEEFTLSISHAGYKTFRSSSLESKTQNLGKLILQRDNTTLNEVVVKSGQGLIEMDGGNLVYNVAKSINAQGVSALEVLKRAPGVFIENERNILLNGKQGPLILIDGKQTYLSGAELADLLRSMPSSSIKSIEIINTPTAKYDAVGSAGIINIRTIKSPLKGFSGSITSGMSAGISMRQNQDISFNYRKKNFNIYGSYNHFLGNYNYFYSSDRIQNGKDYSSSTDDVDKRQRMGSRVGLDYTLNKKNSMGILLSGNFIFGGGLTNTTTGISPTGSPIIQKLLKAENDYYHQLTNRYNANFNYKFENEIGTILTFDIDFGRFKKGNRNRQSNIYADPDQTVTDEYYYHTFNDIDIDLGALKLDYTVTFLKGTLETGAKYSSIQSANDAVFFHSLPSGDSLDLQRTNYFAFREKILSTYLSYKKILGKWTIQGGVRSERTFSRGLLQFKTGVRDTTTANRRKYLDFFPSFGISVKLKNGQGLSFAFSRRLDRPAYQDLNPFIYLLDELSFWQGNPFLQPQYTSKTAIQYSNKSSTVVSLSYLSTTGFSSRITDTLQGSKIVMIPRNLGKQQIASLSLTQNINFFPWWELTFNGSLNYVQNKVSFDQYRSLNLQQWAGRVGLQQRFKLPYSISAEISWYGNTNRLTGANEIARGMSQVDLGLQKNFLKNKLTARIAVADIYKGNVFRSTQSVAGLYLENYGYYETRQLRINLTYKFADASVKSPKTRISALESENGRIK